MSVELNSWQRLLQEIVNTGKVVPKAIADRLRRHPNYLSDIQRRDRVDPIAVFNEILKDAERYAANDPKKFMECCVPIIRLLLGGTNWASVHIDPQQQTKVSRERLCQETGIMLQDLGGAIEAVGRIFEDGKVNENDDAQIEEFRHKSSLMILRLQSIEIELSALRHQGASA